MRFGVFAVLAILSLAVPLGAQVREAIEVRVLELEASVVDRSGRPVEGLTRADFEVRIGKEAVPITNFFAVRDGKIVADDSASAPQKSVAAATSIPTSLVIFIDETNLAPASRTRAFDALKRYVSANLGPDTIATLIRYNKHFDFRVYPTDKPGAILAAIEKIERQPFIDDGLRERLRLMQDIDEILNPPKNSVEGKDYKTVTAHVPGAGANVGVTPDMIFRRLEDYAERRTGEVDRTLAALGKAIEIASAFTGRRALLYVSDGLPQQPALELFEYWDQASRHATGYGSAMDKLSEIGHGKVAESASPSGYEVNTPGTGARNDMAQAARYDRSAAFRTLIATAQKAEVAIYSFDAGGMRVSEGTGAQFASTREAANTVSVAVNLRGGLQYVADETGGLYIANDNDIDGVLSRISEQFSTYYSIGVRPGRGDIRITVKNRPDLRVMSTRRRSPRSREEIVEQNVRTRLYTRKSENPLGAALQVGTAARRDGKCVIPVGLLVPQPRLAPELTPQTVELNMVMLNQKNEESAVQQVVLPFVSGRVTHSMMLSIRPEQHTLSISVLDPVSGEATFLQAEIDGTTCR